MTKYNTD